MDTLEKFAEYANSIHRNIKIELKYSRKKIEFLDTWVHMEMAEFTLVSTGSLLTNNSIYTRH